MRNFDVGGGSRRSVPPNRRILAEMDRPVPICRPLARNGAPFRPRPKAADLRANRRDCRGAHVQPARGHRRRAQLGLPLRLDPGCGIHGLRLPASRLVRRSRTVHALSGFSLQIMYRIDGQKHLVEETLDHLDGYMGSKPVRIGNGAYNQLQLDIYGELLDAAYLYNKHGAQISYDLWTSLRALTDWVCDNWHRKDEGVWEVRGGQREFVYSKLMCWVALDRAIRLADKRSFPAPRDRWLKIRDEIYEDIVSKGWNEKRQAFVQDYGSESLDAANLMMALTFFMAPTDPRMLATLDATLLPLEKGGLTANSLVYRYNIKEARDGLSGEEGTFNICTFWLVEALTRAGRHDRSRLEEARLIFERMLGFANHLGLYAEETGHRGEALGNFPQAFTHLALVSAAFNLDRALGPGR